MLDWLGSGVGPQGEVLSWAGGYAYPEVGGLWLTALAGEPSIDGARKRAVADWLCASVDADGRVGRGEVRYAFDTACVRVGLGELRASGIQVEGTGAILARMDAALVADLEDRVACRPPAEPRWSTTMSAHMLKLAWALEGERAAELLDAVGLCQDQDGRIRNRPGDPSTYLHAACYGLEGLLRLAQVSSVALDVQPMLRRGVAWLASIQGQDGTLPAHISAAGEHGGGRPSDVIAQAIRLWSRVQPDRYPEQRHRGLAALAGRQTPDGAIAYEPQTPHQNTWCTLFTLQALSWCEGGQGTLA